MSKYLEKTTKEIAKHRDEIIERMVRLALTDMLLFWGQQKELVKKQKDIWGPLLDWASESFDTKFNKTDSIIVPEQDKTSGYRVKLFLDSLTDKELAAFYIAASNMKSILLAAALVKGRINAKEAFEAAYLEELWQAQNWGVEEEAESRRKEIKKELEEIEDYLKVK